MWHIKWKKGKMWRKMWRVGTHLYSELQRKGLEGMWAPGGGRGGESRSFSFYSTLFIFYSAYCRAFKIRAATIEGGLWTSEDGCWPETVEKEKEVNAFFAQFSPIWGGEGLDDTLQYPWSRVVKQLKYIHFLPFWLIPNSNLFYFSWFLILEVKY